MASHEILGGLVQVYRRGGKAWHCSTSLKGRQYRTSTKEDRLEQAKAFAEDWYLGLRGKLAAGVLKTETTFAEAAKKFEQEYAVITEGQRSPKWVAGHSIRLRLHLIPFFGKMGLSEISAGTVQDYRVHRISTTTTGRMPARSTLHDEVGTLRQVLKTAIRHKWMQHLRPVAALQDTRQDYASALVQPCRIQAALRSDPAECQGAQKRLLPMGGRATS